MLGALSVAIFGFFASRRPPAPASLRSLAAAGVAELPAFELHVLVPCYTEPLEIVAEAVWAAHAAPLPNSGKGKSKIKKTVWLLDDGNDPTKAAWVAGLTKSETASSSSVKYVSNRPKAPHELNGKASNLNHALGMIYPAGSEIGPNDLVAVFDADQVAAADFWERMLPPFVSSSSSSNAEEVAMVLSPQRFGNVDPASDVFNHGESFWKKKLEVFFRLFLLLRTKNAKMRKKKAHCLFLPLSLSLF
jgi:cellulose synthase/poly-beta-1,6-N-acetylglucosamine synthase-like glycosyltransferase